MKSLNAFSITLMFLLCWMLAPRASAEYLHEKKPRSIGTSYATLLSRLPTDDLVKLPTEKRLSCENKYQTILDDGRIDIRVALGYFDWTNGYVIYEDNLNYGYSPSVDIGAFVAIRSLLLSPCRGKLQFCEFKQDALDPAVFHKNVVVHGRDYPVRIEMHFSSASQIFRKNIGDLRTQQSQRTQFTENFFVRSLQDADAVFYFGHARNGGGPDFAPPVLIPGTNRVNYNGYYLIAKPGLRTMLSAITQTQKPAPIIGMMSCNSRAHFLNPLRAEAPKSGVISSLNVTTIYEVYTATIGAIDAILRGQCQHTFYLSLRMTPRNQRYITMDGIFE